MEGRVKVNHKTVQDLSCEIDTQNDTVTLDGKTVRLENKNIYLMLNKPKGCVTAVKDDLDRKTVMDYLGDIKDRYRLFPVGRLDYDTEGLLIITNDGELTHRLTHPSSQIPKTYIAKIEGEIEKDDLNMLRQGIVLDGEKLSSCQIKLLKLENNLSRLEVTICEGKNRQIHRMFESVGKKVAFLKRVAIGELKLGGLGRGAYRYLTDKEINYLKSC